MCYKELLLSTVVIILDELIFFNRFLLVMFRDTNVNIRVPSFYHIELKRYAILQYPYLFYIVLPSTFF